MKKTLLATMVAATLAMTGCGDKKDNNAADLKTAFDLGQRYSQLNADIAATPTAGNNATLNIVTTAGQGAVAASTSYATTTTTQLIKFVAAEVEALEGVANPSADQISKLGRFKKYQEDFENIQTKLTEYEEMVEKTSMVDAATNEKMKTEFSDIEKNLQESDEELTLGEINTLVGTLHNIVKLERVAAKDKKAKAIFENVLKADFEEAVKAVKDIKPAASDEGFAKELPAYIAMLEQFQADISETTGDKVTKYTSAISIVKGAHKLHDLVSSSKPDVAYITDLKTAIPFIEASHATEAALLAAIVDADIKALLNSFEDKALSIFLIKKIRGYQTPAPLAFAVPTQGQNQAETLLGLQPVGTNLEAAVNTLTKPAA